MDSELTQSNVNCWKLMYLTRFTASEQEAGENGSSLPDRAFHLYSQHFDLLQADIKCKILILFM